MSAGCEREPEVVRAVLEGRWSTDVEAHARGCTDCREVAAVTRWMGDVAREARAAAAAAHRPAASEIWWRAEVLRRVDRRRALARRAVRPIAVFERIAWGAMAAAGAALVWLRAEALGEWIAATGVARALVDPAASLALAGAAAALAVASAWVLAGPRGT